MRILIASHDIDPIARFCDRILLLSMGRIVGYERPEDVVTEKSIKEVFDIDVEIVHSRGAVHAPYRIHGVRAEATEADTEDPGLPDPATDPGRPCVSYRS